MRTDGRDKRDRRGFTLIELMVVVVIIGILATLGIAAYSNMQNHAREASVRSNAHTVQLAAEDFAVQENGLYAASIAAAGPVSGTTITNILMVNGIVPQNPILGGAGIEDGNNYPANDGMVAYGTGGGVAGLDYVIFGTGKDGEQLIRLSNGI